MQKYCPSLTAYERWKTREVKVGGLGIGGNNPIRIQSMTTMDTMDTAGTVAESIRMIESGCELVRITAPSIKEAANLELIRKEIRAAGYDTPLVADIHFTPNAAELAAKIVEKVRVNPGNYADKKKFQTIDYTDATYLAELDRIRERFTPLVKICKEHGTAMRIGTNHGSLSDRILSRYGDTPEGMVQSALEFINICRDESYHNLVISMKASNTQVMVQAYRLLVSRMMELGMDYPLHLGVTEAGEGEDGRIKSAVGIGTLLEDGLGDTVRVSLTEDPEFEAPVAKALVDRYSQRTPHMAITPIDEYPIDPFQYHRRPSTTLVNTGDGHPPVVMADLSKASEIKPKDLQPLGYHYSESLDKWNIKDMAVDWIYVGDREIDFEIPGTLHILSDQKSTQPRHYQLWSLGEFLGTEIDTDKIPVVKVTWPTWELLGASEKWGDRKAILLVEAESRHAMAEMRRLMVELQTKNITVPVIFNRSYRYENENWKLAASTDFGALLLDGLGDGIMVNQVPLEGIEDAMKTCFGILQASRTRISKTEYISCPSCGRTLFNLQQTTAMIRQRTDHLKGVKIGIMGCIVNGPGEMADADYGYVGTGVGKISLYKGQEVVKRNIPSENAVDELIQLIADYGDWVDPV